MSEREERIGRRLAHLASAFGVSGQFMPFDERRPFQMPRAHGDAYTVLEILLGDLVCARDGADSDGCAHPGLLILDCPRERDASLHLYGRFLRLVDEVCREAPALQVIVTTTTAPPGLLREPPVRVLRLSRASDQELLLKRRVEDLLSRLATSPEEPADDDDDDDQETP